MVIAVIDVGGTSIKRGLVTLPDQVEVADPRPIESRAGREVVLNQLADAVADLMDRADECHDLAVAFPRPFDMDNGIPYIRDVNKFDSIYGVPLGPTLQSGVSTPLRISYCGDAAAAAVGEALAGAGANHSRVLMTTLGTGFGSALVVDGQLIEQHDGHVVEDLHHALDVTRRPADESLSAWGLAERLGVTITDVETVAKRREQIDVFEHYGADLGRFLAVEAGCFEPDVIVVGGGAAGAYDLFASSMTEALPMPTEKAQLGSRAALLGAAHLHGSSLA